MTRKALFSDLLSDKSVNERLIDMTEEPYNTQKVCDIADMLLAQLIQRFEEDGIRYPTDLTNPSDWVLRQFRMIPLTVLIDRIDQIISHEDWERIRTLLSYGVDTRGSEASHCKVLVYAETDHPDHLIFEFRAFKLEDNWPQPDGLIYWRNARITT